MFPRAFRNNNCVLTNFEFLDKVTPETARTVISSDCQYMKERRELSGEKIQIENYFFPHLWYHVTFVAHCCVAHCYALTAQVCQCYCGNFEKVSTEISTDADLEQYWMVRKTDYPDLSSARG